LLYVSAAVNCTRSLSVQQSLALKTTVSSLKRGQ